MPERVHRPLTCGVFTILIMVMMGGRSLSVSFRQLSRKTVSFSYNEEEVMPNLLTNAGQVNRMCKACYLIGVCSVNSQATHDGK